MIHPLLLSLQVKSSEKNMFNVIKVPKLHGAKYNLSITIQHCWQYNCLLMIAQKCPFFATAESWKSSNYWCYAQLYSIKSFRQWNRALSKLLTAQRILTTYDSVQNCLLLKVQSFNLLLLKDQWAETTDIEQSYICNYTKNYSLF